MTELWVRPGNLPHGARVSAMWMDESRIRAGSVDDRKASELPFQCLARAALRLVIHHVKDFDGTVRGTCCETLAVVIQLRVVLGKGDCFSNE